MKESLQNIGELIAEPSGTFTRIKSQRRCRKDPGTYHSRNLVGD